MAHQGSPDVVVVGGGVIGLSVAWRAATAGPGVAVVDPSPGRGATWAAAGMLAPVGEAQFGEEELVALNLAAARAWPVFARDLEEASGRSVGYVTAGTLLVGVDGSDLAAVDHVLRYQLELGLAARRLTARACRESEPLLAPGVRGGTELADDHQVDNRCVVDALVAACSAAGVAIHRDEVSSVDVRGGGVDGVDLRSGGGFAVRNVVLCAGCRSGLVGGLPDEVRPPVRPVKGLTLRLRAGAASPRLARTLRGLVHGRRCYLVPRADGTVVVGATVEEKGFDLCVQAGAVGDLLDDARRLVPVLDDYELVETTAGLRPGSPDNGPMVGPSVIGGLVVATGHYRNGILQAPLTAEEVLGVLLSGGDRPGCAHGLGEPRTEWPGRRLFAAFRPDRFARPAGPGQTVRAPGPQR